MILKKLNELFLVLLVLIVVSILIWLTNGDRLLASLFYSPDNGWFGENNELWQFIYTWAPLPAWSMGGLALLLLISGYKSSLLRVYRRQAVFLLLFLLLGPGLVVNVILKDNVGRARPREIVEFQGKHQFTQFWEPGETGANSSFPSGHASIGFAVMGPWFLLRRRLRGDEYQLLLVSLGWGTIVGTARIVQGGHFLSDVIWAGGLVFIVGQLLSIFLKPELDEEFFSDPLHYGRNVD